MDKDKDTASCDHWAHRLSTCTLYNDWSGSRRWRGKEDKKIKVRLDGVPCRLWIWIIILYGYSSHCV